MKIEELRTKNFKGINEVVIRAAGRRVVLIGGRNGQGKSSVLDSIVAALGGGRALPEESLKRGESNGYVEIEVGDFRVVRTFREGGKTSLKVTAKDGGKYGQARLDQVFSKLGPDPVAFLNAKPADQVEIAKEALGIDLSSFDANREETYNARTEVNRDAKRLEGELAGLTRHDDAPEAEESAAEILEQIQAMTDHNAEVARRESVARDADERVADQERYVRRIEEDLAAAKNELQARRRAAAKASESVMEIQRKDIALLQIRLHSIEETNRKVRENQKHDEVKAKLDAAKLQSDQLTNVIESIDAERAKAIKEAHFPVDGLEIGDSGLVLNGLPFSQASSAQRLRISVAMGVAMNPELRVFLIRDGSLLDDDSLAMLCEMAEEHDAQFWIERVGDRDDDAIIIESGALKEAVSQS